MKQRILSLLFNLTIFISVFINCGYKYAPVKGTYISLCPSVTEIIYAIGAQNKLTGVTSWSDYPEEVKKKPRVGSGFFINKEAIIKLKPEYIFALQEHKPIIDDLKLSGIKIYYFSAENLQSIYRNIALTGQITQKTSASNRLIGKLKNKQSCKKTVKPKKILYVIQSEPLISIGSKTLINDLIRKSGHTSITSTLKSKYPKISFEYVILSKPDVVIVPDSNSAGYLSKFIKAKFVILTQKQNELLNRASPRTFEIINFLSGL